ncbi:MAG: SCP2 sterol-binding domain-containing protein [Acidimicrobiia bacterium]|nr:SCP2 sterol-binding domain-containing protein [Acidimicrobiia bacterium]
MADQYIFLTDEWITEAKKIREGMPEAASGPGPEIRMNMVIEACPDHDDFADGVFHGHIDTTEGTISMDKGHVDAPQLTVTVDYDIAKQIFVDQDPQAGMQAFMSGKIKVTGDITKLMAMQSAPPDPNAAAIATKVQEITA